MNGWIVGLVIAAAGFLGCTTIDTGSTAADGVDFSKYRSFAQAPAPTEAPSGMARYNSIVAGKIQTYIATNMEGKGYRKASLDEADFVVRFSLSGKPQTDVWGTTGYGLYRAGGSVQTIHYVQGTLVIDIFDSEARKLVWHGWASARIFESQADGSLAPKAVEKILSRFPPDQGG